MSELRTFFDERKAEVEEYFLFLNSLQIDSSPRFNITLNNFVSFRLSETQIKIFKGNCFLMLYNAIEGTVNQSIVYIIDSINDSSSNYNSLITEIKAIWVKSCMVKNSGAKTIVEMMENVSSNVFDIDLREFSEKNRSYFISGNLYDTTIRKTPVGTKANVISVSDRLGLNFSKADGRLYSIKECRNKLAHGEQSFSEIGQEKLLNDLVKIKDAAWDYLEEYVLTVEDYVTNKKYLVSA